MARRRKLTDKERWERTASRWNAKQAERNPLFADAGMLGEVADLRDAAFYERSQKAYWQGFDELHAKFRRQTRYYRLRISRRDPSGEALRAADEAWESTPTPGTPEYLVSHYSKAWERVAGLGDTRTHEEIQRAIFDKMMGRDVGPDPQPTLVGAES